MVVTEVRVVYKISLSFLSPGAVLEMAIVIGVLKTSGIFFVNFQQRFDSTSSMTSLISTVQNGVFSVAGMYLNNDRFATSRSLHQSIEMYVKILYCIIIPTRYFLKRWGYFNRIRPSICPSVTLSPKPLDEIQPNLM